MSYHPGQFAEKYQLARQAALQEQPQGGLCGFELEWNLLDDQFRPLLTVGTGPSQQSFVDYLRQEILPSWSREFSQLEVFHWMIEWATRPYFHPRGAVFEARLMEATLLNGLHRAGQQFGEHLYAWHGNLLLETPVSHDSIPGSWNLAKRRYLERCVDLYGEALATAGTHTNLSLPEPLLAWDFMHLPAASRVGKASQKHFDDYKSEFYITATRLMRAFTALFIATSASTPLKSVAIDGRAAVVLTEADSVRNLTFPNPPILDAPDLYRSYEDYLHLSYDLVLRGERFGNNNWTPARARSFAEPVERLIAITSEQLHELYARGLYASGQPAGADEMARQIEMQNLMARINLPMARVEIRTDDGGGTLEVDIANLTLKHLLLARFYADPEFGRAFRYDREDIARARRNEELAALRGLRAEIENPMTAKPVGLRDFLRWTLAEVRPLAEALDIWVDLAPLVEMAAGAPNTAEQIRSKLSHELNGREEVPADLLLALAEARQAQVQRDVALIAEMHCTLEGDANKLSEFLQHAREDVHIDPQAPVRFRPRQEHDLIEVSPGDNTGEVLALAQSLIRIPSVTACPQERLEEVQRAAIFAFDYLHDHGLEVRYFDRGKYPALLAAFPGQVFAPVMLSGHLDVVAPDPDDGQFEPRVEGDYLWGRGAADMKTVVSTYLVWMKDQLRKGPPYPPVSLMLIGNEENGESDPMGTRHVLEALSVVPGAPLAESYAPKLFIAGERTGEGGDELWGEICTQNRGVMRFNLVARGQRLHSGVSGVASDLTGRLVQARQDVRSLVESRLTLSSSDGWQSSLTFPFIQAGTPGVYNITPGEGLLGVEIRPIPQDDLNTVQRDLQAYCHEQDLELRLGAMENGVACSSENPYLAELIDVVRSCSGEEPKIGRKLPGTSARFAPSGQGVVWGQSGIGPHSAAERHFIPSILPYYHALEEFGRRLANQ